MIGGEKRNNLYEKVLEFGKNIVLLHRELKQKNIENEIICQLLRSGTSVGANISEAQGSLSDNDYIAKIHIAYKELNETKYWIDLLNQTEDIKNEEYERYNNYITELSKIIYTIIKNFRLKHNK